MSWGQANPNVQLLSLQQVSYEAHPVTGKVQQYDPPLFRVHLRLQQRSQLTHGTEQDAGKIDVQLQCQLPGLQGMPPWEVVDVLLRELSMRHR
jgi:hypothetical protein